MGQKFLEISEKAIQTWRNHPFGFDIISDVKISQN